MPSLSQIFLSSSDLVIEEKPKALSALKENQVIGAKVVKVISSRYARLSMLGVKVMAKTHALLNEGDKISLKVVNDSGGQVLKIIQTQGKDVFRVNHSLISSLGRSGPYATMESVFEDFISSKNSFDPQQRVLLEKIISLCREISLKSEVPDSNWLKTLIRHSGLTWESNILSRFHTKKAVLQKNMENSIPRDLKGLAMKILEIPGNGDKDLKQVIKAFTNNLENFQMLNTHAFEESGRYLLPLPVNFGNLFKFGQMFIDLGKKDDSKKSRKENLIKISFILEMSAIGDVLADFSILKESVMGSFAVGDSDICTFFKEKLHLLTEKLEGRGFKVLKMDCRVIDSEILKHTTLVDRMLPHHDGMLNMVI